MATLAKSTLLRSLDPIPVPADEHSELSPDIEQLRRTAQEWETQRAQLSAELTKTRQLLADADQAAALALERQITTAVDRVRAELDDETDKLRAQVQQLTQASKEYDSERAQLTAQLEEAKRSIADADQAAAIALECQVTTATERIRGEFKAETDKLREELQQQLTRASAQWDKERVELVAERDQAIQALEATREEHIHALAEAQKNSAEAYERDKAAALETLRSELQEQHTQAFAQWDKERAELVAERDQVLQALAALQDEHCRALSEARKAGEADKAAAVEKVRNELQGETDRLRHEMQQQLAQIVADTRKSMVLDFELAADHEQPMIKCSPAEAAKKAIADSIRAEAERVEGLIRCITELIDNEATSLSVVIRKNADRAELESYLRGLRFSIAEN